MNLKSSTQAGTFVLKWTQWFNSKPSTRSCISLSFIYIFKGTIYSQLLETDDFLQSLKTAKNDVSGGV